MRCLIVILTLAALTTPTSSAFPQEAQGKQTSHAKQPSHKKDYIIAVVSRHENPSEAAAFHNGCSRAAEEQAKILDAKVKVLFRSPTKPDAREQAALIEQLLTQGVHAIALDAIDATTLTPTIDAAMARGVFIATFGTDAPASQRVAFSGIDNEEAGRLAATEAVSLTSGHGRVVILQNEFGNEGQAARVLAIKNELARHPAVSVTGPFTFQPRQAEATIRKAQQTIPGINAWILVDGWLTDEALPEDLFGKGTVIAIGALPPPATPVQNGRLHAVIGRDAFAMGQDCVRVLSEKLHLNRAPENQTMYGELRVFRKSDLPRTAEPAPSKD
jgi:ABC-type sugar transport system substrate-binding protein